MRRVFISYSSDDRTVVSGLVQHLEAAGLDVWFDQEISGGQAWWSTILDQLRAADVVVAMVTETSVASAACRAEVSYARALGKTVIPVRLSALAPDDAPSSLQELQWIDYREPTVEIALALVRAAYHAPEVPLPDPLPPAPAAPLSYQAQIVDRIYGTEALNVDQQLAVVYTLRQWIESGGDPSQVLQLATRFRERDDLLASVVAEVDAVVADARSPRPVPANGGTGAPPTPITPPLPPPTPSPTPRPAWQRALLIGSLTVAGLLVLLMIIGAVVGDPDDQAAADTTVASVDTLVPEFTDTTAADTVPAEQFEFEVLGTDSVVSTGLFLVAGEVVIIESDGVIVHDLTTGGQADPIGDPNPDLAQFNITADAAHGALLYSIGDTVPLPVGWYLELTVEQEGELYLGINDVGVDNNDGSFRVRVTIIEGG